MDKKYLPQWYSPGDIDIYVNKCSLIQKLISITKTQNQHLDDRVGWCGLSLYPHKMKFIIYVLNMCLNLPKASLLK